MEVLQFRSKRTTELAEFQKDYDILKTEYSRLLLSAIQEQDPEKQQALIQKVLSINAELSDRVRSIITQINTSDNTEKLNSLTKELIQYQKEYDEIQKGKDSVQTLQMIYENDAMKVKQAESMFYFYIFSILALCLLIVLLIFRIGFMNISSKTISTFTIPTGVQ